MLWRASKESVCIKIVLEKELFSWAVGICLVSAFVLNCQKWIFETCRWLWKVEGGPARVLLLVWAVAAPMGLKTLVWARDREWGSQRSCNWGPGLDCPRQPALASSYCVLSTPARDAVCAQTHLQPLWTCVTALVRGVCPNFWHMPTELKDTTETHQTFHNYPCVVTTGNIHRSHARDQGCQ